jgi:lipopolysaccharide export system permease protein
MENGGLSVAINRIDRFIITRLTLITVFILAVLILLFIIIDFSENSDDFTDRGAKIGFVFKAYYLPYIPEMLRLVTPVAAFIACLLFTGQQSERFEIIALKSSGVSLQRMFMPYLAFSVLAGALLFYLDGWVIPPANLKRHAFEREYLSGKQQPVNNRDLYRQPEPDATMRLQFINDKGTIAFNPEIFEFDSLSVKRHLQVDRMQWDDSLNLWKMESGWIYAIDSAGYQARRIVRFDTVLHVNPRDLARSSSDIYELTYPQILDYLEALDRSGASGEQLPRVQFYSKLLYPLTIVIAMLIGLPLASFRSKRGKGVHLAIGLSVSFVYLTVMKVMEPFGAANAIPPLAAALGAHLLFTAVGLILFWRYRQ